MASESTRRRQQVGVSTSLDQGCPLQQCLAVINVILTAVNYFNISKYHTGVEMVILLFFLPVQMHVCLFCRCFNPPSIFFLVPLPCIFSSYEMRYLISLSPFTCAAEISQPILYNQPHANEWILLFTPSYCSCLSAWGPFERSNDFLTLLQ